MAENLCTDTAINLKNPFFNPEAHTSLQLLHRRSSDEDDNDDDDDDDVEEETAENEQDEEEEEKDEEVEDIKEENGDDTLGLECSNDHVNHSTTPPVSSSLSSFPFPVIWGRGSRPILIVRLFCYFLFS